MSSIFENKHFQLALHDKIEYLLPDHSGQFITIQTQSDKNGQVFTLLDLTRCETLQTKSFDPTYQNLMIKSFDKSQLLVIQFSQQENPDVTNILVFDWQQETPVFELPNTRLISFSNDWIEIPHPYLVGKSTIIDLKSFEPMGSRKVPPPSDQCLFPTAYTKYSEYFNWFVQLLSKTNVVPQKQCEFMKWNDYLLLSYYIDRQGLENYLSIYNLEGRELDKFLLDQQLKGIGKDTFFVIENKLIFVTNKSTLNVLNY